jgi:hypothetical protein
MVIPVIGLDNNCMTYGIDFHDFYVGSLFYDVGFSLAKRLAIGVFTGYTYRETL